jgi:hypothetical protein
MTTKNKKRINITADKEVETALLHAAKRDGIHVTTKATQLLRLALELEEDIALASIANARLASSAKYISHESAWK